MDGLDHQRRELIGRDLVPSHIRGDNFHREFPIDRAGRHARQASFGSPFFEPRYTIPCNFEGAFKISMAITPIRYHPFGSSRPKQPAGLSMVVRVLLVRQEVRPERARAVGL
jgi:hypothetical protein